jgi:uncharacterized protein with GYD domain
MPTYVSFIRYTEQGVRNMKEGPARVDAARKAFQAAGGELKAFYMTFGEYDAVVISEGPNDETAAKLALSIGAQGNLRTTTSRAFTEAEFRKIVAGLP